MKKVVRLLLALWLAVMPVYVGTGFADEKEAKQAELASVKAQMEQVRVQKEAARQKAEAANDRLEDVQGDLNSVQYEYNQLQARSNRLTREINENQQVLAQKKQDLEKRMQAYRKRLRDIYINGQVNYLDVLLGAKNFSDFSSRMYLLQRIISNDLKLLEQIKKDSEEIERRQAALNAQLADIDKTKKLVAERRAQVQKLRDERANVLYKAQEEEMASQSEFERLLALSENIATMLRNMENGNQPQPPSGASAPTGRFIWPCRGPITSYFGWRTHPIFGTTKYHSGMDIAVDYGTPILAADSGTVVYSGWLGGYGYAVMIDHGGGLVTLYAHNQELNVNEGQYVNQGTVVAYAGSTGYSTGPHCHFEARLHGEVTEPLDYLPE